MPHWTIDFTFERGLIHAFTNVEAETVVEAIEACKPRLPTDRGDVNGVQATMTSPKSKGWPRTPPENFPKNWKPRWTVVTGFDKGPPRAWLNIEANTPLGAIGDCRRDLPIDRGAVISVQAVHEASSKYPRFLERLNALRAEDIAEAEKEAF
jgi:hypothetical protein